MWKEFKKFAFKGNVMDLAVGVMIGGAFGAIVTSLVNDIFMPLIGRIFGGLDLSQKYLVLSGKELVNETMTVEQATEAGANVLAYGKFIAAIINFFIIALIIFFVVKGINKLTKKNAEEPKPARKCPYCKSEIADDATRCPHCTSELPKEA